MEILIEHADAPIAFEPVEGERPEPGIGTMLGQHGADFCFSPAAAAADRHRRGGDDGAQHAGSGAAAHDREGHGDCIRRVLRIGKAT